MQYKRIPKEKCLDQTLKLLIEGYLYIPRRCRKYGSDLFQTKLMGKTVICMSGEDSAELFYNNRIFTRKGVMPGRIQKSLFGKKAIQTLDGREHLHRKSLFMSLMTPNAIDRLVSITKKEWEAAGKRFTGRDRIVLLDEAGVILFRAACRWTRVPCAASEIRSRAREMSDMVDAFGAVGPRHWKGRIARCRSERWMEEVVKQVRNGQLTAPIGSILHRIAFHRDEKGKLLKARMAGIELINVIRPITAIATYITFGALAMHLHPECRLKLQNKESNYSHMFAQEVRRFYPLTPFLGAKVRNDFIYNNIRFKKGTLVFLDVYGTNHDPRIWQKHNRFWPEHFLYRDRSPFEFIPQGGGDYNTGHRCPGEWVVVELLKTSMEFLAGRLIYRVPLQNLIYSLRRIPTRPASGFIMEEIRRVTAPTECE